MKRIILLTAIIGIVYSGHCQYTKFSASTPSGHTLYFEISSAGTPGGGVWVTCENPHGSVHFSTTTPAYNNLYGHVVVPDSVEYNGVMYAVTSVGDCAFTRCSNITSVTLPSNIVYFGYSSFEGCTNLSSIIIPEEVVNIGDNAFKHCDSLHTIYFNAVNCSDGTWGNDMFRESNNIEAVYVGSNVTRLPSYLFAACNQLPDIYFYSTTPPVMVTNVFPGGKNITAHVPCNSLINYTSALTGQDGAIFAFQCLSLLAFEITLNSNDSTWGMGSYVALSDSIAEITAIPNYGYHFDHWSFGSTANPDTIMLTDDATITAIFVKNQYSVTGSTNDSTKGLVSGSATVDYLDTVTLTATANHGYQFVRWSDYSTENPRRIAATANITKTAIFDFNQYNLTVQADTSMHGSCNGGGSYNYLSERTIRANANYGYHFTQWNDGNTDNPRVITLTQDTSFIAMFAKNQYTLTVSSNDTTLGSIAGSGTYEYLDTVAISATAIEHYHFVRWDDGNTLNPRNIVMTSDISRSAIFAIDTHSVTLQAANITHGTCSGNGQYQYGTAATVEALPYSGYLFSHWSDGSTYNPYTFAVLEDKNLTAIFVADGEPWQDTVVLYDTTYVIMHDTAYINVLVHDTSYVDVYVHDTTTIIDTMTLTEYVTVHDTTYINVQVHDTTVVTDTVTLTEYVPVHDTTYINVPVHDTTVVTDTLTEYVPVHDTTYINVPVHDTTYINIHDTTYITQTDTVTNTVTVYDTIINTLFDTITNTVYDTTVVFNTDTLWLHDTVFVHDTIYIHDTIVVGVDEVDAINTKIYTNNGQIVVDGAENNTVWLYDVNGRILATKQDEYSPLCFDVPTTGTYLVKIGNHPARKVVVIR
jgi:hypothetical protein